MSDHEKWARWRAAMQAAEEAKKASFKRNRPHVYIEGQDVTEYVVSVLDALFDSLDWGSGFLDDEETTAALELSRLLKFDEREISLKENNMLRAMHGLELIEDESEA